MSDTTPSADLDAIADVLDDLIANAPEWLTGKRGDEHKDALEALSRVRAALTTAEQERDEARQSVVDVTANRDHWQREAMRYAKERDDLACEIRAVHAACDGRASTRHLPSVRVYQAIATADMDRDKAESRATAAEQECARMRDERDAALRAAADALADANEVRLREITKAQRAIDEDVASTLAALTPPPPASREPHPTGEPVSAAAIEGARVSLTEAVKELAPFAGGHDAACLQMRTGGRCSCGYPLGSAALASVKDALAALSHPTPTTGAKED